MESEITSSVNNPASLSANQVARNSVWVKAQQVVCWALAAGFLGWAATAARFRTDEGSLRGTICLPIAVSIAFGLLGGAATKAWRIAASWFALAMVGQAVALQMMDAGKSMHYQHYPSFGILAGTSRWLLVFLAVQTILVLIGFWHRVQPVKIWLLRNFGLWQLGGIAITFVLTSATVSREIPLYLQELPLAAYIQIINLLNLGLAIWAIPESVLSRWKPWLERLTGWENDETGRVDRIVLAAAIWVTVLSAVLNVVSYQRHPHITDEVSYLYHARYLAAGMLTMPMPPVLDGFNLNLFDSDGARWFCSPPPGWPMILSVGVFLGAAWLVNPLLAGLNVILAYLLLRELYDRRLARVAALLMAVSPWYIFQGMSFMTHIAAMTFLLLAGLGVIWARKSGRFGWALMSGLSVGTVGLIRPLEGAIVATLIGAWVIGIGGKRLKFSAIAEWIGGGAVLGAVVLSYNKVLTGSPTKFPIMLWADKVYGPGSNAMGFGPDRGMGWQLDPFPGHGPLDALVNSNLNITAINTELFGWSIGSILLIAVILFSRKLRGSDWLMLALAAAVYTAHFFYWFSGGPDFGARYWFLMFLPCVVLTIRGFQVLSGKLTRDPGTSSLPKTRLLTLVAALSLLTMINFIPWRAVDKYYHYLQMRPDIRSLAATHNFGKSLILIRGAEFPDFASAAIYNPLDLKSDQPIYAWDKNDEVRARLLQAYSDRKVWIVNGPSLTQKGFEVVTGPEKAQQMLSLHSLVQGGNTLYGINFGSGYSPNFNFWASKTEGTSQLAERCKESFSPVFSGSSPVRRE